MKTKFIVGLISLLLLFAALVLVPVSCDFAKPQRTFRLAVPTRQYFYNYVAGHLKPFLERQGYHIAIVPAETAVDANQLVAEGKADLTFINNHSTTIALTLGEQASQLRTLMPLTKRLLFAFSKDPLPDSATAIQFFQNKRVAIEFLGGETHLTMLRFMESAKIDNVTFVTFEEESDVVVFWDRYYGERAAGWYEKGWHPYSFQKNFIEFIMLHDPAIRSFTLPPQPGNPNAIVTHTMATDVMLVVNKDLGENACYLLALALFQNKADLLHQDIMYRSISESFNKETLLFPLHQGTYSYLVRDQPSFFERYAESLALVISLIAVIYGAIQAVQGRLRRSRKENIDKYFLEFLEIRSNKTITRDERVRKLDDLFQRAIVQLTNEKLDKSDFQILSRLIQQDLTMLRFDSLV